MIRKLLPSLALFIFTLTCVGIAYAEVNPSSTAPTGNNYFQFSLSPYTGNDNTGDGGGSYPGNPAHTSFLNYYYVGQQFTTNFLMTTTGASAANIVINYTPADLTASSLQTGNVFGTWSGQAINATQILSTGFNASGSSSSGTNTNFGSVRWTVKQPTELFNSYTTPTLIDIEEGVYGGTLNTNISLAGLDIMNDEEDAFPILWADVIKPYAHLPNPTNGSSGVLVESNYTYQLCDSKDGETLDAGVCMATGVGTGVNTAAPPGVLTFNDGTGAVSYTGSNTFACSGIWGTNQCNGTVNPASPAGIAGDLRNWNYSTNYTANINSFQDRASIAQSQLGEANGPNIMNSKTYTFTTEADTNAPFVQTETPLRGSTNVGISANIVIDLVDRKGSRAAPQNISGTGVVQSTCRFNVTSLNGTLTNLSQASPELLVTPPVTIPYGVRYTIDPAFNFAQNETVSVSVHSCQDSATNTMTTDNYTFVTVDLTAPNVINQNPADNTIVPVNTNIQFDIQDSGVGVDLNLVVIYLNGQYYTRNGGAGQVTGSGTKISFTSSLWFDTATNGPNYVGDTTQVTGTAASYSFLIDPQTDFTNGDVVPIIIYAQDTSNNYMERVVYSVAAGVQLCGNGAVEGYEVCDDGNNVGGDGCSADCTSDETCGNGILDSGEACDDGNTVNGDGCDSSCAYEASTSTSSTPATTGGGVAGGSSGGATTGGSSTSGGMHGSAEVQEPSEPSETEQSQTTGGGAIAGGAETQETPEETEFHGAAEIKIPHLDGAKVEAGKYWYEPLADERLREGDTLSFMLDGKEQNILVREVRAKEVVFDIPGIGTVTAAKGQSFGADLNGDGIADMIFEVKNINIKFSESLIHLEQAHFAPEDTLKRIFEMDKLFSGYVGKGDIIYVTFGTEKHTITVVEIVSDRIILTVQSDTVIVEIMSNTTKEVDITGEGEADLIFGFRGQKQQAGYADIVIRKIETEEPALHASAEPSFKDTLPGLLQSMGGLVYEISKTKPLSLAWAIIILTIALGALYVRWMQLRNKKLFAINNAEREEARKGQRTIKIFIWMIFGAIIAAGIMEGVLMQKNESFEKVEQAAVNASSNIMNVSGMLVDPSTLTGVSNVDLTAGNTTIHTQDHGAFAFYNMDGTIIINHPNLLRTVEKKITDGETDIFYNTEMFNEVIKQLDTEARSHGAADTIVTADDLTDQTIVIGSMQKEKDALKIEVIHDSLSKIYKLTFDGQEWYLVP